MKIAEIRAKSKEELSDMVMTLKKEQFNLRFQEATGTLENKLRARNVRKAIARAKTVMNEAPGSVKPKAEKAPKAKAPAKKKTVKAKKED